MSDKSPGPTDNEFMVLWHQVQAMSVREDAMRARMAELERVASAHWRGFEAGRATTQTNTHPTAK